MSRVAMTDSRVLIENPFGGLGGTRRVHLFFALLGSNLFVHDSYTPNSHLLVRFHLNLPPLVGYLAKPQPVVLWLKQSVQTTRKPVLGPWAVYQSTDSPD